MTPVAKPKTALDHLRSSPVLDVGVGNAILSFPSSTANPGMAQAYAQ